jgi:hypothetical protein
VVRGQSEFTLSATPGTVTARMSAIARTVTTVRAAHIRKDAKHMKF